MNKNDNLPPSKKLDQFMVRFPEGLRDQIAQAAKANGRSMNAEIIHRLEISFESRVEVDKTERRPIFSHHGENVQWLKQLAARLEENLSDKGINDLPEKIETICFEVMGSINVSDNLMNAASLTLFWLHQLKDHDAASKHDELMRDIDSAAHNLLFTLEDRAKALQQRYRDEIERIKQSGLIED